MPNSTFLLGPWVRRFLLEHVIAERNLTQNTQKSYRDALALLLPFTSTKKKQAIDRLNVTDLSAEMLRGFLEHLEKKRECSVRTRNQRLAAIHALARFIAERSPEHIAWAGEIRTVPFKRCGRNEVPYLEKDEIDALLAAPNCSSARGQRDHALLLFMYNSGARATEVASLRISDLELQPRAMGVVQLSGKGRKIRRCPLWPVTAEELLRLTRQRSPDKPLFVNRLGQAITRHGIYGMVRRYTRTASGTCPSLLRKRVSPHTIRHTTATHLLRSGVDINTIRAWLGHVSIETTNIYAEVDLERKTKALSQCTFNASRRHQKRWRDDPSLLGFLRSL